MTLFIDLHGTIAKHSGALSTLLTFPLEVLPGSVETLEKWEKAGHQIIITTGVPESYRPVVEQQLRKAGVLYHQMIMGLGGSKRILINDLKEGVTRNDAAQDANKLTATAICLERNKGIEQVRL